jgi:hypothetical protein
VAVMWSRFRLRVMREVLNLRDGVIAGVEAFLGRMRHPNRLRTSFTPATLV